MSAYNFTVLGADTTGFVIDLRKVVSGKKYNRVSALKAYLNGSGGVMRLLPIVVDDDTDPPATPGAASFATGNPLDWFWLASGDQPLDLELGPEKALATHLLGYCYTAGTAAQLRVQTR